MIDWPGLIESHECLFAVECPHLGSPRVALRQRYGMPSNKRLGQCQYSVTRADGSASMKSVHELAGSLSRGVRIPRRDAEEKSSVLPDRCKTLVFEPAPSSGRRSPLIRLRDLGARRLGEQDHHLKDFIWSADQCRDLRHQRRSVEDVLVAEIPEPPSEERRREPLSDQVRRQGASDFLAAGLVTTADGSLPTNQVVGVDVRRLW